MTAWYAGSSLVLILAATGFLYWVLAASFEVEDTRTLGNMITDLRLVGAPLAGQYGPDVVAAPVRLADADAVSLLRPGDRVDVIAAGSGSPEPDGDTPASGGGVGVVATVLAADVPVVTIPAAGFV